MQLLATNPDVDAIVLDSDFLAPGIVTNIQTKGYGKTGEDNHIYMIGSNGNPEALDYIRQGWMDKTFSTPIVDFAGIAVELAANIVNQQPVPDQWTEEGKAWSPADISAPNYGGPNFPTETKAYNGPVLLMQAVPVGPDNVDDPTLWGNMAASK
jgi:ABC-type sugar transport system substrate-binding protein